MREARKYIPRERPSRAYRLIISAFLLVDWSFLWNQRAVLKTAMMQYLKELTLSEPITHRYWVRLQVTAEKCWGGLGRINHGVYSLHADLPRKDGLLTRRGTSKAMASRFYFYSFSGCEFLISTIQFSLVKMLILDINNLIVDINNDIFYIRNYPPNCWYQKYIFRYQKWTLSLTSDN